jgi:adenine-specific DNA-methyltransferase
VQELRCPQPFDSFTVIEHVQVRQFVSEKEARSQEAKIWVWRESDSSMPAGKQAESTKDPSHENFRFYKPTHPITHKPCPHPKRGWVWPYETLTSRQSFKALDEDHRIVYGANENKIPQVKSFLHETETNVSKSVIHDYTDGEKELTNVAGATNTFPNPKPTTLISRFIQQTCNPDEIVMDFFVGSGATGQALLNVNRLDHGNRKYIFIETEEYFDTVFKPRIKKVIYTKDWRDGKPVSGEGTSHLFKYIRLESYEDALNNLELKRTEEQASLLEMHNEFREDYMLRYMLDVEARGSASLLNIENFADPFNYQLNVATGASVSETRPVTVDLVESFNYLLGLRVKHVDTIRGFRVVEGTNPEGEKALVIWRNTREKSNDDLDHFFQKQGYNTRDRQFDLIYTNGDNNLENLKRADETWKVRLIEEEFQRLMFDVQDV